MERSVESPRTNLQKNANREQPKLTRRPVQGATLSVRSKEMNDIFRYFEAMHTIVAANKIAVPNKKRRKRNPAHDLVGIESNPGPVYGPRTKAQAKKAAKRATKKAKKGKRSRKGSAKPLTANMSRSARDYMLSVLQPCAGNARIPDLNCTPTSLVTLTQEFSLVANAQGVAGVYFYPSSFCQYQLETGASTDAVIALGGAISLTGASSMIAGASFVRVVSACVDVTYTGNSQTDGGIITGASFPVFNLHAMEPVPSSLVGLQNTRMNTTSLAREGIVVFHRPADSNSFDFKSTASVVNMGALVVHISGVTPNTAPFMVKITCNYECIPSNDNSSWSSGQRPSPVDMNGLGAAVSTLSATPAQTSRKAASNMTNVFKPILAGVVEHGPSIAGFLKNIFSSSNALF